MSNLSVSKGATENFNSHPLLFYNRQKNATLMHHYQVAKIDQK
jgi:hypothetical protein